VQVIIRFSDAADDSLTETLRQSVWPLVELVSQQYLTRHEYLLDNILAIHEQLLKNAPALVAPHFRLTVQYVYEVFASTKNPNALGFFARAVEVYGNSDIESFQELLTHIATAVFHHIVNGIMPESAELLRAFFELCHRYLLYCPAALLGSPQFSAIVSCGVECLTACQGERESTRATLIFLSQLFGWQSLRISSEGLTTLQSASQGLNELLLQHGAKLTHSCMMTLLGGPQMLWPACTDCLFAIVLVSAAWPVPEDSESSVAQQWLMAARPTAIDPVSSTAQVYEQVVALLLSLVRDGQSKGRPRAKMLLMDYCKIHKGEMGVDALVTYRLS
jgi:hypothetical protein